MWLLPRLAKTQRLNMKACNVRISYLGGVETYKGSPVVPLVDAHGTMARLSVVKLTEHLDE